VEVRVPGGVNPSTTVRIRDTFWTATIHLNFLGGNFTTHLIFCMHVVFWVVNLQDLAIHLNFWMVSGFTTHLDFWLVNYHPKPIYHPSVK